MAFRVRKKVAGGKSCVDRNEQMHMIGHDDEIMQLEFSRRDIRTQDVDEQRCIAFRIATRPGPCSSSW